MSSKTAKTLLNFLVSEEHQSDSGATLRLDKFLAEELAEQFSREQLKRLIQQDAVTVNDSIQTKASFSLKEGDTVTLAVPEAKPLELAAEAIPLDVIYEDNCLLIVNKPSGMLTHPTGREQTGTLVNALLSYCEGRLSGINGVIRPGIVHRLDRETSGLLVVAKTDIAHRKLADQLREKTMRREYYAVAQGIFKTPTGTVDAPIGRNPKHREKMGISETGRHAVTHWHVLEAFHSKYSHLRLQLETGRTHQIRVHMAHIGHPIVGDPLYGTGLEKVLRLDKLPGFRGQLLQAFRLTLTHPETQKSMQFEIEADPVLQHALKFLKNEGEPQEENPHD